VCLTHRSVGVTTRRPPAPAVQGVFAVPGEVTVVSPAPPRAGLVVSGRVHSAYSVRDVAEVDAALCRLAAWFADQVCRSRTLTRALITNVRHDQDRLLDARLCYMRGELE